MNRRFGIFLLVMCIASCSGSPEAGRKPTEPVHEDDAGKEIVVPETPKKSMPVSAAFIVPKGALTYRGKKLVLVQTLKDPQKTTRGRLYVELMNDTSFRRLYILNGTNLKYFAGDCYFTNGSDTIPIDEKVKGFRFRKRTGKSVVIGGVDAKGKFCTDDWTIQYVEDEKGFDNPYLD